MPTLFSYRIPRDNGAAPNPFWGVCTLVICKPAIRRAARVGDWIVGTGSAVSPIGDISGKVVYAMRVGLKMTMLEYEMYVQEHLPNKIPQAKHPNVRYRLGDAIYDFSSEPPKVRPSVHTERNRETDLRGRYALISDVFFYFGDKPIQLPSELIEITQQRRGHRSQLNDKYREPFINWLFDLGLESNQLYGEPPSLKSLVADSPLISISDIRNL